MDDWTPLKGLRRAAARALLRAMPAVLVLAAGTWLITPVLELFTVAIFSGGGWGSMGTFAIFGFIFILVGLALGYGLSRQMVEIAGCQSLLLSTMLLGAALGAAWLATSLAALARPLGPWQTFIVIAVGLGAAVWIARATIIET